MVKNQSRGIGFLMEALSDSMEDEIARSSPQQLTALGNSGIRRRPSRGHRDVGATSRKRVRLLV